jgi:hypothetical protein
MAMGNNYKFSTDRKEHHGPDSGCRKATLKLGQQSKCFDCPFPKCVGDKRVPVFSDILPARLAMYLSYGSYYTGLKVKRGSYV